MATKTTRSAQLSRSSLRTDPEIELPRWCSDYIAPARYKVSYGGRGSGKSWAFARMLLLKMVQQPLRVLCARELQISIRDSVHRLLSDQITAMGLQDHFEVGESFIRAKNGGEVLFKGLRHNAQEIKSMESIGIAWIEEAQAVSAASWELLIPTVRGPGSEIWITFNPGEETDPTYQRFVVSTPPNTIIKRVNWDMNPWFPPELAAEKDYLARVDPDAYAHVWQGECRAMSNAQVLHNKYIVDTFEPGPDWHGPYYGADWGFSVDPSTLVRSWIHGKMLYIEHEAYGVGVDIDALPQMFDEVPRARQFTIRADCARPETISYMVKQGFRIVGAGKWKGSVEDGVAYLRGFEQIVIHPRCVHTIEEAHRWRYKVDKLTGDVLPVLMPGNEHCWDAIRYAHEPLIGGRTVEKKERQKVRVPQGAGAWMG